MTWFSCAAKHQTAECHGRTATTVSCVQFSGNAWIAVQSDVAVALQWYRCNRLFWCGKTSVFMDENVFGHIGTFFALSTNNFSERKIMIDVINTTTVACTGNYGALGVALFVYYAVVIGFWSSVAVATGLAVRKIVKAVR